MATASNISLGLPMIHYPPLATNTNNISFAVNGTGAPGIYTTSYTDDNDYGIYNWCNMPHVRSREYPTTAPEYTLRYVEVIHRHHKRTPYSSNIFPTGEDIIWDCPEAGPLYYGQDFAAHTDQVTPVQWYAYSDLKNPFTTAVGYNGSNCQFPQETSGGLTDSYQHGQDLAALYREKLRFLPSSIDSSQIQFRVTNNVITSQVAGALVKGMYPESKYQEVLIQNDAFDSLEPAYSCSAANTVKSVYQGSGTPWPEHLIQAAPIYSKLDAVTNIAEDDNTGFHASFDHFYDNLSARQCHGFPLPCNLNDTSLCIEQETADAVYRLGNWEWSYYYRDPANSTLYDANSYGVWILELQRNIAAKVARRSQMLYSHNVAHDDSVGPLLGALQIQEMVWPGMGAEVVFELYEREEDGMGEFYIRVLWGGQVMKTSLPAPLNTLNMVPWETFDTYLTELIGTPENLYDYCNGL